MKILIFGSNGMLGNYISKYLEILGYDVISITRKEYDLNLITIDSLLFFLNKNKIKSNDVIINCAGIIPQSKNKIINNESYYKINSIFPIILNMLCDKLNCKMIHITTDCVFDGKEGRYNELYKPTETNDYGVSKLLGEICNATIIRTSIIGEELYNKTSLLEWVKSNKNKEINGYTQHFWNGVTCLQLSKIIEHIIRNNLYWNGIRHIFSPEIISKYDLVELINHIYNLNIKINKFETEKVNKSLSTIYETFYNVPNLKDQIIEQNEFNFY